jgi:S-disulfanyl-L-cysteine oxidoreductase SoxD
VRSGVRRLFFASVLGLAAAGPAAGNAWADGFTAEQAAAGQTAYDSNCARCHGARLEGVEAPALAGRNVMQTFNMAGGLYDVISVEMPPDAPGSLGEKTYLDIIAYVMSFNGAKPGDKALAKNGDLYRLSLVKETAAGTAAAAPAAVATPASVRVPQAYTFGKQLPGGAAPPKLAQPSVPQAFTWGKKLPQAATQ